MSATAVARHYGRPDVLGAILRALREAGVPDDAPTVEDLAAFDHFHTRGRAATLELLGRAGLRRGMAVLDVGGGLGGAARLIAQQVGCAVTVLELTEEYVRAGRELTRRTGLADRVAFVRGDALAAPFPDATFDVVWTQHSSMNIRDKPRLYREARRVLKPSGRLAMHEITAGRNQPIHFPVPWAREAAASHLASPVELRWLLARNGLREVTWEDQSRVSLAFNRKRLSALGDPARPPGLELILGSEFATMAANQVRNLEEERIRVVMTVWEARDPPPSAEAGDAARG
jgi:SAM-dependent methyltransferase